MLITDLRTIGNTLYKIRKNKGLTQANVAEKAELSDRTYADIERGSVNMRIETLLKICHALGITPNDILTIEQPPIVTEAELAEKINQCSDTEKQTARNLLDVYLRSLNK
jgi:transcriptional regulator with XRE-family HTH domain